MLLDKVKRHLKDCGFSIMRDFLLDGAISESGYVAMCSNICASLYRVEMIDSWDHITRMLAIDELAILGYCTLQELMDDVYPGEDKEVCYMRVGS